MGYDIRGWGVARIEASKAKWAYAALWAAVQEKGEHQNTPDRVELQVSVRLERLIDDVTRCFTGFVVTPASVGSNRFHGSVGDVLIEPSDDSFRHLNDDAWAFEALAPFIDEGDEFEFNGEDGVRWKWAFKNGVVNEVSSHLVWGRDEHAPTIAGEVEDLIYDSATGKIKVHEDPQAVLDQIEELLRKNGFGPFAGLETLDIIAKAVE